MNRQTSSRKSSPPRPRRSGKQFMITFASESDLAKVKQAAARAHAKHRDVMGKRFPNTSLFIVEAALEKAEQMLRKKAGAA